MIHIIKGIAAGLLARHFLQHQRLYIGAFLVAVALTIASVAIVLALFIATGAIQ